MRAQKLAGPLTEAHLKNNGADPGRLSIALSADSEWVYFAKPTGQVAREPECNGPPYPEPPTALPAEAQVFRVQPDGSRCEQLTQGSGYKYFPTPTPDGRWVSFVSHEGRFRNAWAIPTTGSGRIAIQLTDLPCYLGIEAGSRWSPK